MRTLALTTIVVALGACTLSAAPVTETLVFREGVDGYAGTVDTYVANTAPSTTFGESETLIGGGRGGREALVRFTGIFGLTAGHIPQVPSLTIDDATFEINRIAGSNGTVKVLYISAGTWDESTTESTYSLSKAANPDDDTFFTQLGQNSVEVTTIVSQWADNTLANMGFSTYRDGSADTEFASSEYTVDPGLRPALHVTFTYESTEIPEPASALLLSAGLLGILRRTRQIRR